MFSKTLSLSSLVRFGLIAFVMVLGVFISARSTEVALAAPHASNTKLTQQLDSTSTPNSPNDEVFCSVQNAGVYLQLSVLVHCTSGNGDITWWGVSSTDRVEANRVLSVALTAQATNRKVWIVYDPDGQNNPLQCLPINCRKILWIGTTGDPAN